jgi:hypothetical protein
MPLQKPLVSIATGDGNLGGELEVPAGASGLVLFAHGSSSDGKSCRGGGIAGRPARSRRFWKFTRDSPG